jgi:predicted enzyme related to lactoylglutathione lyase
MLYIAVSSCDASAKRAAEVGGTVLMAPMDVFTAGRMAVLQDPTGVVFCIWEAKEHIGLRLKAEEGSFCWADLLTNDRDRAAEFYSALFGWHIDKEGAEEHHYYHIRNGDEHIGGIPSPDQQLPGTHPHWSIYLQTADCEKKTAQAQSLGAKILTANWKHENVGTLSILADPQGATFCVFQSARK